MKSAFTLIEMSVVIVIIGLIVGGILVGQSLINAAAARSQVTQIEKYNSAVETFYGKYEYLPGDMPQKAVQQFGFTAAITRAGIDYNQSKGRGNGDAILEGSRYDGTSSSGFVQGGETLWFWEDLTTNSRLIEGGFSSATDAANTPNPLVGATQIMLYLPQGKIGQNTFVMAGNYNSQNYFFLTAIGNYDCSPSPCFQDGLANSTTSSGPSALQAQAMDSKVDDGLPTTGNVQFAAIINNNPIGLGTAGYTGSVCYNTTTLKYNTNTSSICPLVFRFQ